MRADVPDRMNAADIFVTATRSEGLPVSALESMACGKPVVATVAPGLATVVADGETGFLVPVERGEAMADAIAKLAADADLRAAMGTAARNRAVSLFSVERMAEQYASLYTDLIGRPRLRRAPERIIPERRTADA